jgi:hypothetical protein
MERRGGYDRDRLASRETETSSARTVRSSRPERPEHFIDRLPQVGMPMAGRRFHFSDPSGNELAVWSDK